MLVTMAPFRRSSNAPSSPVPVTESPDSVATDMAFHFLRRISRYAAKYWPCRLFAIPFRGIQQHDAAGLFVLQQLEGRTRASAAQFRPRAPCRHTVPAGWQCSISPSEPPTRPL